MPFARRRNRWAKCLEGSESQYHYNRQTMAHTGHEDQVVVLELFRRLVERGIYSQNEISLMQCRVTSTTYSQAEP